MDNEKMIKMDSNILLSYINTKLRDEYNSLEVLCEDFDLQKDILVDKLGKLGYKYLEDKNQFVSD